MADARCPGCGGEFPDIDGPTHPYMESSPGCWAAYGEVLAREYGNRELMEIHRMTVDTYAIQHPGQPSTQSIRSVNLHLVRLFMQLEGNLPAERANKMMTLLGGIKDEFTWLEPPPSRGDVNVGSVSACKDEASHKTAVRKWARSALAAWSMHRAVFERWAAVAEALERGHG